MGMSIDEAIEKLSASILIIGPEGQVKARDILIICLPQAIRGV